MKKKEVLLILVLLALDQITKYLVASKLVLYESIQIIPGFFSITYTVNTGGAWSILQGQMWFLVILTIVALVAFFWYLFKTDKKETLTRTVISLLIAGTLGNFVDRVVLGKVRDFLDFNIFGYDFPIFNVADITLCVGVGLLILSYILPDRKKHG